MGEIKQMKKRNICLFCGLLILISNISCKIHTNMNGNYYKYPLKPNFVNIGAKITDSTIVLISEKISDKYFYIKSDDTLYLYSLKKDCVNNERNQPQKTIFYNRNFLLIENININKETDFFYEINSPILLKKNNLFYEIRIWLNTIFSDKNQIKSINKISIKRCKVINDIFKKDCLIKVYKPTERGL